MRSIINGFSADHLSGSIILNVIFTECQALTYNISNTKLIAWEYKLTGISEWQKVNTAKTEINEILSIKWQSFSFT